MFKDKDFTENEIYQKLLNDKLSVNLGYLYENIVAQCLAANGNELFYHAIMNQKSAHNYEIDFILVVNWFLNNSIISQTVRRFLHLVTKKCRN